jgi:DMSO/TMAO reductase YedYZ molybdopterin-dependent catalytic subunit
MSARSAADLLVLGESPYNAETRLERVVGSLTPPGRHYVRNHFAVPADDGVLRVDGAVRRPLAVEANELVQRATRTLTVTLECAGNGRRFLDPPAPGEQWGLGAVGTAEWTVLPLTDLLAEAEPRPDAVDLVFRGADSGLVAAIGRTIAFERSLPVADLPSAFLAVAMNGKPLTSNHGAPIRLLVPGRYGMASVKWLARITAVTEPFRGFFQADRYVVDDRPLGPIAPRALIASPVDRATIPMGPIAIRGFAWSGAGPVQRVEVSTDGGATWSDADLGPAGGPTAWRPWSADWLPGVAGEATLLAVATDAAGERQPVAQVRNTLGYRNNEARPVTITIAA